MKMIHLLALVAVIAVLLFIAKPARAQFRPCVWPNTCAAAQ